MPLVSFCTPWKHKIIIGFLMFPGAMTLLVFRPVNLARPCLRFFVAEHLKFLFDSFLDFVCKHGCMYSVGVVCTGLCANSFWLKSYFSLMTLKDTYFQVSYFRKSIAHDRRNAVNLFSLHIHWPVSVRRKHWSILPLFSNSHSHLTVDVFSILNHSGTNLTLFWGQIFCS